MKTGDHVTVSGTAGTVRGEVIDVRRVDELPAIPAAGDVAQVRAILREAGADLVAMIEYRIGVQTVMFVAVRSGETWRDLHGQRLTITR